MKLLVFVVCLFAMGVATGLGCAKPPPTTAFENAAAVAQYKALLVACREKGKAAKSYAVYEACADQVDADLCRTSSLRCGGAK